MSNVIIEDRPDNRYAVYCGKCRVHVDTVSVNVHLDIIFDWVKSEHRCEA